MKDITTNAGCHFSFMGCSFLSCYNIKNSSRLCENVTLDLSEIKVSRKRQCNFYLNFAIISKHVHILNFSLSYLIPPWTGDAFSAVAFTSCAVSQCMRGFWQKRLYIYGIDCWLVMGCKFWYCCQVAGRRRFIQKGRRETGGRRERKIRRK